ncbi:outer membrane protein assembly factor BamE [Jannaschia seohaensis]|uniref:Outer membrane protein assembly factor BamE (Lipoprotein component of BamABCDE complex) n=1 Tax=Jannaschia seohaensis TaxID=475081 RepID=A0A2Y9C7I6_9RHOB|nr:outer membrane protein assembly factor BamE [Jannaschia seohaensis]PWJ19098.1 outer membrane protein assembly factor BamE (lipoprotein component of BamABCDE complex) [Jannaschia seohaensis]SSA45723.1 Outer membrane protein assembly factor BamE, lipoprotein component of the BamABCDE complex [Jannaschia seohaensis]
MIGRLSLAAVCAGGLTACAATFQNHGYVPDEAMLQEVIVGVDTRDSVESLVGRPSTAGVLSEDNWYFVRSRVRSFAWRAPETIERELVAISFGEDGTVENIERFGLEDGRVVTLSRRITDTSIRDFGLIQQLLRNFGRVDIGETLAAGN